MHELRNADHRTVAGELQIGGVRVDVMIVVVVRRRQR
jgi:hypothetical protein